MSPPGGPLCPPVLLALLLGLPRSSGSPQCQDQAVSTAGSLCLVPEKPSWEWTEVHWRVKNDEGSQERILTAFRDRPVSYTKGRFHRRANFQQETLSLCLSLVLKEDSGVYTAEFQNSTGTLTPQCFRVSVWDPIPQPALQTQILDRDRDWCHLSVLCSGPGNVSYGWDCPGDPAGIEGDPKGIEEDPSRLLLRIPQGGEPQICLCNLSNPAGWSAASTELACPAPGNLGSWPAVAVAVAVAVGLTLLLLGSCCWWRKRRKNSREGTPGTPSGPLEQPLTIYAEVGAKKPNQDPTRTSEEGATIYAVVTPRTLEHPRCPEDSGNCTLYSTVQVGRRPSSVKRKRLDRALVSTAYLEDNEGYRRLGFPNPGGHQRP